jgi:simple sugar transport system permease protein
MNFILSADFWFSVLAGTTPVMLATLAANIVSQSGMFNLGIEGTMLMSALMGVLVSAFTQSLFLGMLAGLLAGIILSFALGYFTLYLEAPMNSVGVAINLFSAGVTVFVLTLITGSKVTSSSLTSLTFPAVHIPLIRDIPFLGRVLSGHNLITYLGWIFAVGLSFLLYRTRLGLDIRATGRNAEAAASVGIQTNRVRFKALLLCGIFCGFGGMYLSMGALKSFTANMVAGRGFLSLAMDTLSSSHPLLGWGGSLLYGFSETITIYLQLYSDADLKVISAFPYIFIILVLVIAQLARNLLVRRKKNIQLKGR